MRAFGFLCLLMLIGTAAFICHGYSNEGILSSNPADLMYHSYPSSDSGMVSTGSNATSVLKSRKLKESTAPDEDENRDHFSVDDNRPIDPVPNSEAAIRPGPIQYGTPLMPYIPNPPSPSPGKPQHAP